MAFCLDDDKCSVPSLPGGVEGMKDCQVETLWNVRDIRSKQDFQVPRSQKKPTKFSTTPWARLIWSNPKPWKWHCKPMMLPQCHLARQLQGKTFPGMWHRRFWIYSLRLRDVPGIQVSEWPCSCVPFSDFKCMTFQRLSLQHPRKSPWYESYRGLPWHVDFGCTDPGNRPATGNPNLATCFLWSHFSVHKSVAPISGAWLLKPMIVHSIWMYLVSTTNQTIRCHHPVGWIEVPVFWAPL